VALGSLNLQPVDISSTNNVKAETGQIDPVSSHGSTYLSAKWNFDNGIWR